MNRPCWIPPVATCPHCQTSLRVSGPAALTSKLVADFRQRHFGNCRSNPAALAARKATHELLCVSND